MANKNLRKNGANIQSPLDVPHAGTPVTSGIHRAAERAGIETPEEIDRTDEELDILRNLVGLAESTFEHQGEGGAPVAILREALRCAQDDFDVIRDAQTTSDGGVEEMFFLRCDSRIALALALFEYREEFGYVESERRAERAGVVRARAAAEGGAS